MKTILICPDRRPAVAHLATRRPLALLPFCGKTLLDHALTFLADHGALEVTLLAPDRPDDIRQAVGGGEKWGTKIKVVSVEREPGIAEAAAGFRHEKSGWMKQPWDVFVLDRLPQLPALPLFDSYEGWFSALRAWLPQAAGERVGAREWAPGIWVGMRSQISPEAQLWAPCWIGDRVCLQAGAVVGPNAVIEDGAVIDRQAEVSEALIGPGTYVGALTEVRHAAAWGEQLVSFRTGSLAILGDAFLLSDIERPVARATSPWYARLAALLALVLTSPILAAAWWRCRRPGQKVFEPRIAVQPQPTAPDAPGPSLRYYELNGLSGPARRWPQLWSIVRGDFNWVGNRPLTRQQAAELSSEFEQLWLAAPVGLISLADSYACRDAFGEEARAHSSFYAVHNHRRQDLSILWQTTCRLFFSPLQPSRP
jgi:hypothetical protein